MLRSYVISIVVLRFFETQYTYFKAASTYNVNNVTECMFVTGNTA